MNSQRFSTQDVKETEGFDYWRDAVCDAYVQVGCEATSPANFYGSIHLERFSRLSVSQVTGRAHEVTRRRIDIARAEKPFFLISFQRHACANLAQHNRSVDLRPGDFALYSSTEPYKLKLSDDSKQLVVQIPRSDLLMRLPNADLLTGRLVSSTEGLAKLVSNSIIQFADEIDSANGVVQQHMQETMIDLIATGMSVISQASPEASVAEQQLLLRAKQTILMQLSNPDLDRTAVSKAMKVSVRRLNEIFAKEHTSISSFIRDRRLERIAEELRDLRFSALSISEIAMRWGVNNFQHFSRLFRKRYGVSAREYRNGVKTSIATTQNCK